MNDNSHNITLELSLHFQIVYFYAISNSEIDE